MFYEEKLIDGILMFRNRPKMEWTQVSIEKMSRLIIELRGEVRFDNERAYIQGKNYEKDRISELLGLSHD